MRQNVTPSNHWIFDPVVDLIFIVLTPVPILLAFGVAARRGWSDLLIAFVFSLAMAHYFPGILRAYTDRELFRRFRIRLIVAPVFLITATTVLAYFDFKFMFLLVTLWGAWHWLMQVYGFARIYDARSGARTPPLMDRLLCIIWFGMCMFVLSNVMPMYVTRFYESGGPAVPAAAIAWLSRIWIAGTITFTLFYLFLTIRNARKGIAPNPLKLVFIAITFGYLAYTVSRIHQPLMGYAMFESWHDIQYLAIVWLFNLNRARNNPAAGGVIRFFFRPRVPLLAAYILLCLLFGLLTHAWRLFDNGAAARIALALVMSTALLHYYLDGFIWKIRDEQTRQALGVASAPGFRAPLALVPGWTKQALLWSLFVVPAGLLFAMEASSSSTPLRIFENLVQTFPSSAQAHFELGRTLQQAGRLEDAIRHLARAVSLDPAMPDAHALLGGLLISKGDFADAKPHLEYLLNVQPTNAQARNNLGIIYDQQNDLINAKHEFELAVRADPAYALAHNNLGIVLAKLGLPAQARDHHESALRINPEFGDAHYQLGVVLAMQGDMEGAAEHLQQAVRINPQEYLAYNSLGAVLANQGKFLEAKAYFEQALRLNPGFTDAEQNLAKTQAKMRAPQ
jgi:tetratricopeptide (TPR) repeat protein